MWHSTQRTAERQSNPPTHPAMEGMAVTAFTLLIVMMAPPRFCSTICRAAAWPVRNVPFRLLQGRHGWLLLAY